MAFRSRNSYRLSWLETVERRGPGRKTQQLGVQVFPASQIADLLQRAEELLGYGYEVHLLPPLGQQIDASQLEGPDASAAVIPVTASLP